MRAMWRAKGVSSGVATILVIGGLSNPGSSAEPPGTTAAAVSASNAFGLDLYRRLADASDRNVFISPYSILNALGMTAAGAREHTAVEMHRALHFPEKPEEVHAGLAVLNRRFTRSGGGPATQEAEREVERLQKELDAIRARMQSADWREQEAIAAEERQAVDRINGLLAKIDPTDIAVANALWGEKTYSFAKSYLAMVGAHYGTDVVQQADFRANAEGERGRINAWVEKATRDRIRDLLPPGSVDAVTRLVLTNAIYFKGEWENPFEEARTREEDFTLADGRLVKLPLMQRTSMKGARYGAFNADGSFFDTPVKVPMEGDSALRYPSDDGFAMVELPYRGGKLAMVVIAPNRADGLEAIEAKLDSKSLAGWIGQLRQREVDVFLPRFKTETEYDLNEALIAMGMKSAFKDPRQPDGANFRGMTDSQDPNDQLCIALVRHKAFVDVNEEGTEAAAATAVVMRLTAAMVEMIPFTPVFRADRPFLYLIRDVGTDCLLFVGRMTKL